MSYQPPHKRMEKTTYGINPAKPWLNSQSNNKKMASNPVLVTYVDGKTTLSDSNTPVSLGDLARIRNVQYYPKQW